MNSPQAPNIDNEYVQATKQPGESVRKSIIPDASGRKRQKTAHVTTLAMPTHKLPLGTSATVFTGDDISTVIDGSGEWDYLLRWEHEDRDAIDVENMTIDELTDEAVDEEEFDEPEEAEETANGESHELLGDGKDIGEASSRSKLSRDQIVEIINEQIEHFTYTWEPNKGVHKDDKIEYDTEKMWERAEASGERHRLVRKHETDAAYYGQRLDKLCDEILSFPGSNADRVRYQCANLEVTINSMLLSQWLVSIYVLDAVESEEEELHKEVPTARPAEQLCGIIDLGSPPESSQEYVEGVLVNSSPPPKANVEKCHSSRYYNPDFVIVETVEPPVRAPSPNIPAGPSASLPSQVQLGDEPEKASIVSARRWSWVDLVGTLDRKRIVTKALSEMTSDDRETIRSRLTIVGKTDMIREIPVCIQMLAKNETRMQGVLARDLPKIVTFTRLFLCWWLCDNYFRVEPSKWHLEELRQCLHDGSSDPSTFCDYLNKIMTTTFSLEALCHPEQPSQAEVIEISDDDEGSPPPFVATQRKSQAQRPQLFQQSTIIVLD